MNFNMRIKINVVYPLILGIAVVLSACGEKKKARDPQPPPPPPPAAQSTPTPPVKMEEVSGQGGLDLPPPVPPGNQAGGPAPIPAPAPAPGEAKEPLSKETGYVPVDPRQIERTDVEKRYTGFENEDGLLYTGSSTDYLLTYLRLRNEDPYLDEEIRVRNLMAAQSVESARLKMDSSSGDVVVVLKIREGHNVKTYVLAGGFDEEGSVSKLKLVKRNAQGKTTGSQNIEGKFKCLDLHKRSCETAFARFVLKTPGGSRAAVAILFRQSLADYKVTFSKTPEDPREMNEEYEHIRAFWKNTVNNVQTRHKLKNIYLNSYEIVNGRSGFEVQILGEGRQLLTFSAPLLAPESGTAIRVTADRTPQPIGSLDSDSLDRYNFTMADMVGRAEVVNNNGLGQVRLVVRMRKRAGTEVESFKLLIMRIIKPTISPDEDNLRL